MSIMATPATTVEPELLAFTEDELVISYFLRDTFNKGRIFSNFKRI
jgi:hypothetical protein